MQLVEGDAGAKASEEEVQGDEELKEADHEPGGDHIGWPEE